MSPLDNVTTATNQFQVYRFASGPGWTTVGALANLTATAPRRQTASVAASTLNDTFTVTDQTQILPVTLIAFSGRQREDQIELNWVTASEKNFDYFLVERSADGKNYNSIATLKGKGSSTVGANYLITDEKPFAGVSYYRLKSVDVDGAFEYSKTISVEYSHEFKVWVYPNPFNGRQITLATNFFPVQGSHITVFNHMGQPIEGFLLKNELATQLNFSDELPVGLYFVRYYSQEQNATIRVVVAR